MSRQEATNTFSEGLIKDLNPLNTPDNVLTDCLNGTIITYDGNEFLLQNDKGNFKLKNARLSPNFIPVGVKEYANILYIVSYNPITKETEIGSYPSPQRIFSTRDRDNVVEYIPIVPDNQTVNDTYENLTRDIKLQIYTQSSDNDSYMLNPGDEFRLEVTKDLQFPYQELQFYVLSEDRNLYEVEMTDEYINQLAFKKVFWNIPGWLCGRYRLANPDAFYLNVVSMNLPEFIPESTFDTSINLNVQLEISDELFLNNPNTNTDLKVKIDLYTESNGVETNRNTYYSTVLKRQNYNNISPIYYFNFEDLELQGLTLDSVIYISAVPILESTGSTIIYEQFRTDLEFNLNSVNEATDINAANSLYKWIATTESLTLAFNIDGPFAAGSTTQVRYDIINLAGTKIVNNQLLTDVNLFGQNVINIPFGNGFNKEDIYIFIIHFYQGNEELRTINKLLITSELFNDYYDTISEYNSSIYADEWLAKLKDYTTFDNLSFTLQDTTTSRYRDEPSFPTNYVMSGTTVPSAIGFRTGFNVTNRYTLTKALNTLTGNLWTNMNKSFRISYSYGNEVVTNNLSTGASDNIDVTVPIYYQVTYSFTRNSNTRILRFTPQYLSTKLGYGSGNKGISSDTYFKWHGWRNDSSGSNNDFRGRWEMRYTPTPSSSATYSNIPGYGSYSQERPSPNKATNVVSPLPMKFLGDYNIPFTLLELQCNNAILTIDYGSQASTSCYGILGRINDNGTVATANRAFWIPLVGTQNMFDGGLNGYQQCLNAINQFCKHVFYAANISGVAGITVTPFLQSQNEFNNVAFNYINLLASLSDPYYNANNINVDIFTINGLAVIRNQIASIINSLQQVNPIAIDLTNLITSDGQNIENELEFTHSFDVPDPIYYNLSNDSNIQQDISKYLGYEQTEIVRANDAVTANERRLRVLSETTSGKFYHDLYLQENDVQTKITEYENILAELGTNAGLNSFIFRNQSKDWAKFSASSGSKQAYTFYIARTGSNVKMPRADSIIDDTLKETGN